MSKSYNLHYFDLTYSVTNAKIKQPFTTLKVFMVRQVKLVVVSNKKPRF